MRAFLYLYVEIASMVRLVAAPDDDVGMTCGFGLGCSLLRVTNG
ncbi:hypothetical protein [Sphingobium ummariense]|uniref:Uncharacterized protein n=1 Tax=Sphingobium ummariense RL-3 TaxID=1346791 RepID=T0K874_9SPHN|nr:hypothetical protein [Sphingobium ummariense]EQB32864.1 hypothetical protein M529_07445 [Sphingobium ummariense RL-3]